jgi:hypothetical protein
LHSPQALRALGFDIQCAAPFGAPQGGPSLWEKYKAVARNPIACAQFFNVSVDAFYAVFLGMPRGELKQINPDAPFGKVRAYYHRDECSGRGALHAHGQVIQVDLQPARLRLLQKHNMPELRRFLQQIASKQLPVGWHVDGSAPWVAGVDGSREALDFKHIDGSYAAAHEFPASHHLSELRTDEPLDPTGPNGSCGW